MIEIVYSWQGEHLLTMTCSSLPNFEHRIKLPDGTILKPLEVITPDAGNDDNVFNVQLVESSW